MNEIIKMPAQGEVTRPAFTRDQIELIKSQICVGASDDELKLFLYVCQRTGLDPFKRQIFAFKSWDAKAGREKTLTHTSIDGYRLIAQRSGKFQGRLGPQWCRDDGVWKDVWLERGKPPAAARVGIRHVDFPEPAYSVATYASFARRKKDGTVISQWVQMPDVMLAKCAESAAIRAAFPEDTANLYTTEELEQAQDDPAEDLVPIRKRVEEGIALMKSISASAQAKQDLLAAGDAGKLRALLARVQSFLARQADKQAFREHVKNDLYPDGTAGGAEAPSAGSPGPAVSSPPAKEEPARWAQEAGPAPSAAAPAQATTTPLSASAGAATVAPAGAPPSELFGDAYEGEVDDATKPVRIPSVDEVLAVIGTNQRVHADKVIQACTDPDGPATVSIAIANLLVGLEGGQLAGEEAVAKRWLAAGSDGCVTWIHDKRLGRRAAVFRAITARELLQVLGLDKPLVKP